MQSTCFSIAHAFYCMCFSTVVPYRHTLHTCQTTNEYRQSPFPEEGLQKATQLKLLSTTEWRRAVFPTFCTSCLACLQTLFRLVEGLSNPGSGKSEGIQNGEQEEEELREQESACYHVGCCQIICLTTWLTICIHLGWSQMQLFNT